MINLRTSELAEILGTSLRRVRSLRIFQRGHTHPLPLRSSQDEAAMFSDPGDLSQSLQHVAAIIDATAMVQQRP